MIASDIAPKSPVAPANSASVGRWTGNAPAVVEQAKRKTEKLAATKFADVFPDSLRLVDFLDGYGIRTAADVNALIEAVDDGLIVFAQAMDAALGAGTWDVFAARARRYGVKVFS